MLRVLKEVSPGKVHAPLKSALKPASKGTKISAEVFQRIHQMLLGHLADSEVKEKDLIRMPCRKEDGVQAG